MSQRQTVFFFVLAFILVGIFLFGLILITKINVDLGILPSFRAALKIKEAAKTKDEIPVKISPLPLQIITIKDATCSQCFDIESVVTFLNKKNIKVTSKQDFDYKSKEAKDFIRLYQIEKIPVLIAQAMTPHSISPLFEGGEKEGGSGIKELRAFFESYGTVKDDVFIFRQVPSPYLDLKSKTIRGKIVLTMLTDKICKDCYDVNLNKIALSNLGVKPVKEETINVSSVRGKELVKKYQIIFIPTIILSPEAKEYQNLNNVWKTVGTIEKDGSYVLREGVKMMGTYKDLKTGKVIRKE